MSSHSVAKLRDDVTPAMAVRMPAFDDPAREANRLELALTPATPAEIADALQYLFRLLPMANGGETDEEKDETTAVMMAGYMTALRDMPRWAIVEVRGDFMGGRVPGQSLEFAPKPPALGHEVAKRVDAMRAKLSRMRRQANERAAIDDAATKPLSPELREIGRRRVEELRAIGMGETRRANGRPLTPSEPETSGITEEALEAAGVPRASARGTGAMQKVAPPAFDPMSRRPTR